MRRCNIASLVCVLVLFSYPALAAASATRTHSDSCPMVINAQVTLDQLFDGYHSWMLETEHGKPEHFKLKSPSIDLYSPAGQPLYYGTDSNQNASFIRRLLRGIPKESPISQGDRRPTLEQALAMFPELRPYATKSCASRYTLFSMQSAAKMNGTAQAKAIEEFESDARRLGIRVISVIVRR